MSTPIHEKPAAENASGLPAAVATRIASGLGFVGERLTSESLTERLRQQLRVLLARLRSALDLPSRDEVEELTRRVEEVGAKLAELEKLQARAAPPSTADVREELRGELSAKLGELAETAREAGRAAAREEAAAARGADAGEGAESATPNSAKSRNASGQNARSQNAKSQNAKSQNAKSQKKNASGGKGRKGGAKSGQKAAAGRSAKASEGETGPSGGDS